MPDRPVAVARELTKFYEEVARGTAAELAERFAEPPKGEIVLVLGPTETAVTPEGRGSGDVQRWPSSSRQGCRGGARPSSCRA